jgi:putative phosphoesterase
MLIGIMSDSHDNLVNIRKAVKVFTERGVGALIHAGDFCSPFFFREMEQLKQQGLRMHGVFGNNDGDKVLLTRVSAGFAELRDAVLTLELEGRKIAVMHYPDVAESLHRSGDFDLVVFGHTHNIVASGTKDKLLNPGTCSGYLTGKATVALVSTEELTLELVTLA